MRLAIGSMAVTPLRLRRTEEVLLGRAWSPALVGEARRRWKRKSLLSMTFVPAQFTGCMLQAICCRSFSRASSNEPGVGALACATADEAAAEILSCCGSRAWAAS